MKRITYGLLFFILPLLITCKIEREPFPLPEDTPSVPVGDDLAEMLHNPASDYNTILIDPLNPDLPADFMDRWDQAVANVKDWESNGTSGRKLSSMYIHFGEKDTVNIVALYHVMASSHKALARYTYTMPLDDSQTGKLNFVSQNGNAANLAPLIAPVLAYFLEEYTFQVKWVDENISTFPLEGVELGGFFRTDNPSSFLFGPLSQIDALTTSEWPTQTSPIIPRFFTIDDPIDRPFYTSISVNPEDPEQPQAFRDLWSAVKSDLNASSGRTLHQFVMVFDPDFSRMRLMMYYYTAGGAKSSGFFRYIPDVYFDDKIKFDFNSENANAALIRDARLFDDFLESHIFTIQEMDAPTSDGQKYVRLVSTTNPDLSFFGYLGNLSASCCSIWPD